jgi:small subunit ribosomal protein S4e
VQLGAKGIPYLTTHDGRTIRYPDPAIRVNDTIKLSLPTKPESAPSQTTLQVTPTGMPPAPKIESFIHFEPGVLVMCTGGRNIGRVGVILNRERHHGGFDIVHVRDVIDREFSTRIGNIFVRSGRSR